MNCKYHEDTLANNKCSVCGENICDDCSLNIKSKIYCKNCLKESLKDDNLDTNTVPNNTEIPKTNKSHQSNYFSYKRGSINSIIFYICNIIPGCAQMYLGLMKRGILILLTFLSLLYIGIGIFPIFLWIVSFFDSFKIKENIKNNIYQEDGISDITQFVMENKLFFFGLIIIIGVASIINFLRPIILRFVFDDLEDIVFQLAIIVGLIVFGAIIIAIISSKNKKGDKNI